MNTNDPRHKSIADVMKGLGTKPLVDKKQGGRGLENAQAAFDDDLEPVFPEDIQAHVCGADQ